MKTKHPILNKPITGLDLSNEFKEMCNENRFTTLAEIISHSTSELLKKRSFNMHSMMELLDILDRYNLGKIIDDTNET